MGSFFDIMKKFKVLHNPKTGKLKDGVVTKANAAVFVSTEQTADGNPQSIAHGLGAVPAAVLIVLTKALAAEVVVAEGTHTTTNVVVTVTNTAKYKVFAWA